MSNQGLFGEECLFKVEKRLNRKYWKPAIVLCLMCCFCGCGKTEAPDGQEAKASGKQETEAPDEQGTEALGGQEEASEQQETEGELSDFPLITVQKIEVHRESMAYHIGALIQTDSEIDAKDYAPNYMQILEMQMTPTEGGVRIDWYGFCTGDDADIAKPSISYELEEYTNVENEASVEEIEGRELRTDVNGHPVTAWITPFSVSIEPREEWRAEGTFYDVTVTDESGAEYFLVRLPVMDDRKPSQKKQYPLPDMNAGNLPYLGEESGFMVEREYCGVQLAFSELLSEETLRSLEEIHFEEIPYQ